jgi:ribonuclease-3
MAEKTAEPGTLEERIGYTFADKDLLARALTHPSYLQGNDSTGHNQRLEFLGDAVLGLVLAEALFAELPAEREGTLTRFRSMLAKGNQLALIAREIDLGAALRMGDAEDSMGVRERPSILEDALEAVIGAVYRDGGLENARKVVLHLYGPLAKRLDFQMEAHNPKGRLQEIHQPTLGNQAIEYRLVEESGPDHCKHFTVEVWIGGTCRGRGSGNSKKLAEEAAAMEALEEAS